MPIRVLSCDNFDITNLVAYTVEAKAYEWTARVSSDAMIHIKRMERDADREGSLTFSAAATDADAVALVSQHDDVEFVFGDGTGGTVDKGIDEIESAQNLKAAIEAYVLENNLDFVISGAGAALTFTTNDPYVFFEVVIDDGTVMTLVAMDYAEPASEDDAPFNEFDDLFFSVGEGEGLSFICGEDFGFASVAEVKMSS